MTDILQMPGNGGVAAAPLWYRQNYSDEIPFSYRSGLTYQEVLETIRAWIPDTLIPYLAVNFTGFTESMDQLSTTVDDALSAQETAVNTVLAAQASIISDGLNSLAEGAPFLVPAPSGGDDTAVLQALIVAAQATEGTLILRKGTYLANLETTNQFIQPRILGQGRDYTILKAFTNTKPVIRLKGGAGRLSGGFLADFDIRGADAGGGVGLQLADPGGVSWTRLKFSGALTDGIQYLSESAGAFSEFNHGDAYFKNTVGIAVHYVRTGGNESFHGSGITEGSVIERTSTATSPPILIDANCFPYGAPLSATLFMSTPGMSVIRNLNPNRVASFHGHLDLEIASTGTNITVGDPNQGSIFYQGTIGALQSASNLTMGRFYLVDKVYFIGSNTYAMGRQTQQAITITANPQAISPKSGTATMQVDIRKGGQYHYSYMLHFWPNPYGAGGAVTVMANASAINVTGYGPPVFSIVNGQLTVTNPAYPLDGTVIAFVTVNNQNVTLATDTFNQS